MLIAELRKPRPWPNRLVAVGLTFVALSVLGPVLTGLVDPSAVARVVAYSGPALVGGLGVSLFGLVVARRRTARP
jgi:hypothetical protein